MRDSNFIDSSVWLEYFHNSNFREILEESNIHLFTSILSLFEIKKKLLKEKCSEEKINIILRFIKTHSLIINLNNKIVEKSAEISIEKNLPSFDSLIYISSLLNESTLLTLDNDFRGLNNVKFLSIR